jgi:GAF domain-containing protein
VFLYAFSGSAERLSNLSAQEIRHLKTFNSFNADEAGSDPDAIAQYTIDLLQDQLGYNLVQMYFADETGMVIRRIRTAGVVDTRFNTRIEDLPLIGEAIRARAPRVFKRDASTLAEYPLAPARVGIAVPILYLGLPLGLLDVQSRIPEEPTQNQLDGFGDFGDHIARALMNSRKTVDLQRTVEGQEDVIASFRTRLTELQQRSAQIISGGWSHYLEGRGRNTIGFDLETPEGKAVAKAASDLPVDIREAILRGDIHVAQYGEDQVVNVPILLRDEPLGAMSFTIPSSRPVTDRQIEVLRTVANRLGQALENNRLFEQSQAQARRERKANEVGARLIGATNLESLLDLAAESFNDALGAVYTRIYIEPSVIAEQPASHVNGHANGNNGTGMNGHEGSDPEETGEGGQD